MTVRICSASLAICIALVSIVRAQDSFSSATELLQRFVKSREELFQYAVEITIHGRLPVADELFQTITKRNSVTKLDLEYSRIGEHFLTLANLGATDVPNRWYVIGCTDDYMVEGDTESGICYTKIVRRELGDRNTTELLVFDPRAIGILLAEEYSRGIRYETIISTLSQIPDADSQVSFLEGKWTVRWPAFGAQLALDSARSYWPISFDFSPKDSNIRQRWIVKLGKFQSKDVPVHAEFEVIATEKKRERTLEKVSFDFRWKSINQYLPNGERAVKRLSERFGLEIKETPNN